MRTYAEPDIMELNYHAGTACWTVAQSVVTEHVGVRFYGSEIVDAITAVLLISISKFGGIIFLYRRVITILAFVLTCIVEFNKSKSLLMS